MNSRSVLVSHHNFVKGGPWYKALFSIYVFTRTETGRKQERKIALKSYTFKHCPATLCSHIHRHACIHSVHVTTSSLTERMTLGQVPHKIHKSPTYSMYPHFYTKDSRMLSKTGTAYLLLIDDEDTGPDSNSGP